ncbi:MAG: hypothetical protein ACXWCM_05340 [Acidimicrobiales bacterium]
MGRKRVWSLDEVQAWFVGRMPDGWFVEAPSVSADREEIVVVGRLAEPDLTADAGGERADELAEVACRTRVAAFREDTREHRMKIAADAEMLWDRKVSWGARCGSVDARFTSQSVAAMTRLRFDERAVLDTLIDAGVARSRSEALAWCVRLVGRHQSDWITQLREAMAQVEQVRSDGPDLD